MTDEERMATILDAIAKIDKAHARNVSETTAKYYARGGPWIVGKFEHFAKWFIDKPDTLFTLYFDSEDVARAVCDAMNASYSVAVEDMQKQLWKLRMGDK